MDDLPRVLGRGAEMSSANPSESVSCPAGCCSRPSDTSWRRSEPRLAMLALAIGLLFVGSGSAFAHSFHIHRNLTLQIGVEESLLLLRYEIPKGEQASLLRSIHDTDRDGHLDGGEQKRLAGVLSQRAFANLTLRRNGEELPAQNIDWRVVAREGAAASIGVVFLVTLPGGPGRYEVAAPEMDDERFPASIEVEAGEGLRIETASSPTEEGLRVPMRSLRPGDLLWVECVSLPTEAEADPAAR